MSQKITKNQLTSVGAIFDMTKTAVKQVVGDSIDENKLDSMIANKIINRVGVKAEREEG